MFSPASSAFVRTKARTRTALQLCRACSACWDAIPTPCEHHASVMAAHSCGVLKERFAKTQSLHRHETEQRVWAAPNKRLQGKGLCIYKDPCLAREFCCTRMVPRSTACRSYCIHLNCQFRSQLLYWTHQKFFRRQLP